MCPLQSILGRCKGYIAKLQCATALSLFFELQEASAHLQMFGMHSWYLRNDNIVGSTILILEMQSVCTIPEAALAVAVANPPT